jgi:hypothetical protein
MAINVGKISGPLLRDDLLRDGINLAFETDLVYLDVNNRRVGVKTNSPTHDLTVNGTTRTTFLEVLNSAVVGDLVLDNNQIYSTTGTLNLSPTIGGQVVYQSKLLVDDIQIEGNQIATVNSNADLNFTTSGTGTINLNGNTEVIGNLHATGSITADGNLQLGDSNTDSITFNADIASNIIPDIDNTFQLGTGSKRWKDIWVGTLHADAVVTGAITVSGIDIASTQGNIYYVATNGDDGNAGQHQNDPLSSVGRALDLASAGDTVYIYPGTYSEALPLTIPVGVTVKGAGIRSVTIQPDSDVTVDVFLMNGETTVEDLTITGFEYDVGTNTGYAFRFAPNMIVSTRSPYIRNVSVITAGSTVRLMTNPVDDPGGFLAGDAGKGAYVDGSIVNSASNKASMLFNSATFITPGVDSITMTNGVRVEWLNSFTYFANRGLYAVSGSTGFAGSGNTRLRIDTRVGTWAVGNTVRYYDTDSTTILASGVIDSIDGNYVTLTGKCIGFETITDRTPTTLYAQGGAKLSTLIKKFGASSLELDGVGDYVTHPSTPDFAFGTGDFTVEGWFYHVNNATQDMFEFRTSGTSQAAISLSYTSSNLVLNVLGSTRITGTSALPLNNTWYHVALARSGTSTKLFVNGTQVGSTWTDTTNYIAAPLYLGARYDGAIPWNGYIDEVRISKGVARYTTTFTAPTAAFVGDLDTVLLLHFDGLNGSTIFLDDGITLQDIRNITTGGTASIINFADYSEFGAEIRSISSANVYGNYGAYGDGDGVIAYLIGVNLAYIGSGRYSNNDPNDVIQANEVVELNRAHIYYTSVDAQGDFRVGDFFVVDQQTGTITFNPSSLEITSSTGVTFTDGVNTTIVSPTKVETGNIRISGNTIQSLSGGITLTAASNQINLTSNTTISGTVDLQENFTVQGNTVIGDSPSDLLTINSRINSNIVPNASAAYDLGSLSNSWRNVYLAQADIDNIRISGNVITTTTSNADLELRANGSGIVRIPNDNLVVNQNLTVSGTTSLTNATVSGTLNVSSLNVNSAVQSGTFTTDDIIIQGNVIRTSLSNSNLELRANGSGAVLFENFSVQGSTISGLVSGQDLEFTPSGTGVFRVNSDQALTLPIGTDTQRPLSPQSGMIRFNSSVNQFEGYTGTAWIQFGSVIDVDRNTYVIPELSPGSNENTLYFVADGNLAATLDSNQFNVNKLLVDQIEINGNVIRTVSTNTDLELRPNGTGAVVIDGFRITTNTITNTNAGAITTLGSTGSGYFNFTGTAGVVIPSGDNFQRPGVPQTGMMRYSTSLQFVEVWDGTSWISVAGTGSGINLDQATEIAIAQVLLFG